jgi:hypothetical protein
LGKALIEDIVILLSEKSSASLIRQLTALIRPQAIDKESNVSFIHAHQLSESLRGLAGQSRADDERSVSMAGAGARQGSCRLGHAANG